MTSLIVPNQTVNNMAVPILFIEGGIGCGKSTLVKKIQEYCEKYHLRIKTIQEPVDIWTTIVDESTGKNMIEAFYEDQEKYSFEFQMMAYISRLQRLQETMLHSTEKYDLIICERSLQTDRNVFCKMLYDEGKITEYGYQIYNKWFDYFQKDYQKNAKFVYLQTDYKICYERVGKRNRNGESNIAEEYLKNNNAYHDEWLLNDESERVLILDGNKDGEQEPAVFDEHIQTIFDKFVK